MSYLYEAEFEMLPGLGSVGGTVFALQSLTGKYRVFTGKLGYREIQITCFVSVQGLKGQILMKYREIYAFCTGISILYLHLYLCFYNRDFPVSLFFEKQQHQNLLKQGKSCKLNREKMLGNQGNNVTKTVKRCYKSRENPVTEP